jgi:hypothetical protein
LTLKGAWDEKDEACSMLGTKTCLHGSDGKSPKERNHLESTENERVILKRVVNVIGVVCGMVCVA